MMWPFNYFKKNEVEPVVEREELQKVMMARKRTINSTIEKIMAIREDALDIIEEGAPPDDEAGND